jgi:TRAP-type C4-dicarboxylate transport system permease small subunit
MELLLKVEKAIGGALLLLLTVTIFLQVLFRFVFDLPLAWSEELSRYSFVWLTMIVAPICIRLKANISTGTLGSLPPQLSRLVEVVGLLLALAFALVLLVWGTMLLDVVKLQRSPAIGLPMYWVYAAIPTGAALMIIELAAQLIMKLRSHARAGNA